MKKILLIIALISFTFSYAQLNCSVPTNVTTSAITFSTANISWVQPQNIDGSTATAWEVVVLPCGTPTPTINTLE
jgi:hypothetical protein